MLRRTARIQQPRAQRRRRGVGAKIALGCVLIFLLTPLYRLQVSATEEYTLQAKQNRMRPVVVRAPRGTIYDRHGRVVAENIVGYQVLLMPGREDSLRAQISRLEPITGLDSASVEYAFRRYLRQRHLPMELMRDAPPEVAARLLERLQEFPGVLVQEYAKRHYPAGPAIAHFIGYINEIDERQLAQDRFKGYEQGRWVGKAGLELQYEEHLGGVPGVQYLEIDARGRIQQFLPDTVGAPPIPGKDLHLHLDLDLQEYIYRIFPKEFTGAIVAIDPQTGGVLAYYSNPSFDPNEFIGGVSTRYYNQLRDDPAIPLLDRVVGSGQPAASTWKLAVAGMALDLGVIRPDEYMPVPCTGGFFYGRYARCWLPSGHGRMNLIEGIKNSCNVFFYQVGVRIGLERFMQTGTRLGFNQKTGIDVPHEITPIFPTGYAAYQRRFGYKPNDNEVLSLAIGQSMLTMTAIKLAHIYSALTAPDGKVPAPRLAVESTPPDTFQLKLSDRDQWYLKAGMRRVVGPGGTAQISRLVDWDFIGKTGSAQSNNPELDHAWFVGMGAVKPADDPEIAVTMFLEYGEHGYTASGYAAEAINFYLSRKYGKPFRMYATPRLRFRHNLPVDWDFFTPVVDPPIPPAEPKPGATAAAQPSGSAAGAATLGRPSAPAVR